MSARRSLQQDHALAKAIFAWFERKCGLGSPFNARDVIELTKIVRGKPRGEDPIKVPLHVIDDLAKCLQYTHDASYGELLSAAQIKTAEAVLRRWYKTQ